MFKKKQPQITPEQELQALFLRVADGAKINLNLIYKALIFHSVLPRFDTVQEAVDKTNDVALQLDKSQIIPESEENETV